MRSFAKVDFPDPFGPHIMMTGDFWLPGVGNLANVWFHSGVAITGCKYVFWGASFEEYTFNLSAEEFHTIQVMLQFGSCFSSFLSVTGQIVSSMLRYHRSTAFQITKRMV
jgi:hypothetical protein